MSLYNTLCSLTHPFPLPAAASIVAPGSTAARPTSILPFPLYTRHSSLRLDLHLSRSGLVVHPPLLGRTPLIHVRVVLQLVLWLVRPLGVRTSCGSPSSPAGASDPILNLCLSLPTTGLSHPTHTRTIPTPCSRFSWQGVCQHVRDGHSRRPPLAPGRPSRTSRSSAVGRPASPSSPHSPARR